MALRQPRPQLRALQQLPAATRKEAELSREVGHLAWEVDRAVNLLENHASNAVDGAFRAATGDPFTHFFLLRRAGRPVPADLEDHVRTEAEALRHAFRDQV